MALAASALWAHGETPMPERVQVIWATPDTLSEVKHNPMQYGIMRPEDWMTRLGDYMRLRADRVLPPGQQLEIAINDITLAGSYEPWHRPPVLYDVRYMTDIYPPRLTLHYRLMASDGSTLREKDVRLIDLGYLQKTGLPTDTDPLRYDKRQIDDWLKHEFRPR